MTTMGKWKEGTSLLNSSFTPNARAMMVARSTASSRLSPSRTYCSIAVLGGTDGLEWKARRIGTVRPDDGSLNGSDKEFEGGAEETEENGCGAFGERKGGMVVDSCVIKGDATGVSEVVK